MKKKVCILSLDGGGIRGIISGEIVKALEVQLQLLSKTDKHIGDFFDFIAGTSTGGIMAASYLVPNENNNAKYSAQDVQEMYTTKGDAIFHSTLIHKWISLLYDEKYDATKFEKELELFFGNVMLGSLIKPCLITAYNIEGRNAKLFNSRSVKNPGEDFLLRDVVRASSAAPTYFEPARIKRNDGFVFSLIDGGVYANNPALCAYAEVRKFDFEAKGIFKPSAKDLLIVSIGAGTVDNPYPFETVKNYGSIHWVKPIIDILMSASAETVHYQLRKMFQTLSEEDANDYIRLEPLLNLAESEMDNVKALNIQNLISDGQNFVNKNESLIQKTAEKILSYQ